MYGVQSRKLSASVSSSSPDPSEKSAEPEQFVSTPSQTSATPGLIANRESSQSVVALKPPPLSVYGVQSRKLSASVSSSSPDPSEKFAEPEQFVSTPSQTSGSPGLIPVSVSSQSSPSVKPALDALT